MTDKINNMSEYIKIVNEHLERYSKIERDLKQSFEIAVEFPDLFNEELNSEFLSIFKNSVDQNKLKKFSTNPKTNRVRFILATIKTYQEFTEFIWNFHKEEFLFCDIRMYDEIHDLIINYCEENLDPELHDAAREVIRKTAPTFCFYKKTDNPVSQIYDESSLVKINVSDIYVENQIVNGKEVFINTFDYIFRIGFIANMVSYYITNDLCDWDSIEFKLCPIVSRTDNFVDFNNYFIIIKTDPKKIIDVFYDIYEGGKPFVGTLLEKTYKSYIISFLGPRGMAYNTQYENNKKSIPYVPVVELEFNDKMLLFTQLFNKYKFSRKMCAKKNCSDRRCRSLHPHQKLCYNIKNGTCGNNKCDSGPQYVHNYEIDQFPKDHFSSDLKPKKKNHTDHNKNNYGNKTEIKKHFHSNNKHSPNKKQNFCPLIKEKKCKGYNCTLGDEFIHYHKNK